MKKKTIGIIALGAFLLLAGCSSKGEVKRDAHGREVLIYHAIGSLCALSVGNSVG